MIQIEKIELIFENVECVTIDVKDNSFILEDITRENIVISRLGDVLIYDKVNDLRMTIKEDTKILENNLYENITLKDRLLQCNDITGITLYLKDMETEEKSKKEYSVLWCEENDVINYFQKTTLTEGATPNDSAIEISINRYNFYTNEVKSENKIQ